MTRETMVYYWMNRDQIKCSLNKLYPIAGITKQGFHKHLKVKKSYSEEESYVMNIVHDVRSDHPTLACRYIYYKMNPVFIGRDRFEKLCREMGFTVEKKRKAKRTTDSTGVKRFPNLIKDKELNDIDQAWSSDITYFEVNNVFYYITFIMDNYSRKILSHSVSSRLLCSQTTLPALRRAIASRGHKIKPGIIFHSDGGGQYYADDFLALTKGHEFENSMCKYAWENGKAERINGVIKNNYLKHWSIKSLEDLVKKVDRAVKLYNEDKPHSSLQRMTPVEYEKKLTILKQQNKKGEQVVLSKTRITTGIEPDVMRAKQKGLLMCPKQN